MSEMELIRRAKVVSHRGSAVLPATKRHKVSSALYEGARAELASLPGGEAAWRRKWTVLTFPYPDRQTRVVVEMRVWPRDAAS